MEILLQNRLDFYRFLLPRLPDEMMRARFREISEQDSVAVSSLPDTLEAIDSYTLNLVDALKKPRFGERWGKTTVSVQEALERASQLEEWIALATSQKKSALTSQLHEIAARRLNELRTLEDNLRYHRLRLETTL